MHSILLLAFQWLGRDFDIYSPEPIKIEHNKHIPWIGILSPVKYFACLIFMHSNFRCQTYVVTKIGIIRIGEIFYWRKYLDLQYIIIKIFGIR